MNLQELLQRAIPDYLAREEAAAAGWRYEAGRTDGAYHAKIAGNSPAFARLATWLATPAAAGSIDPSDSTGARSHGALVCGVMFGRTPTPDEVTHFWNVRSRYPHLVEHPDYMEGWLTGAEEILAGLPAGSPAGSWVPTVPAAPSGTTPAGHPGPDGDSTTKGETTMRTEAELRVMYAKLDAYLNDRRSYRHQLMTQYSMLGELAMLEYVLGRAAPDNPVFATMAAVNRAQPDPGQTAG